MATTARPLVIDTAGLRLAPVLLGPSSPLLIAGVAFADAPAPTPLSPPSPPPRASSLHHFCLTSPTPCTPATPSPYHHHRSHGHSHGRGHHGPPKLVVRSDVTALLDQSPPSAGRIRRWVDVQTTISVMSRGTLVPPRPSSRAVASKTTLVPARKHRATLVPPRKSKSALAPPRPEGKRCKEEKEKEKGRREERDHRHYHHHHHHHRHSTPTQA
jgi:hypothetical protein